MSSLNIENLTKEVIREIVLERFFGTQDLSKFISEVSLSDLTNSVKTSTAPKSEGLVWSKSRRRTLIEMDVGSVKYVARPRKVPANYFREYWGGARRACRRLVGGEWKFYNTETGLKIERVA